MDFRISQQIARPLADVERALLDERFITASADLPKLDDCRLLSSKTDANKVELRIHRRFNEKLPVAVTAIVDPDRLTWIEEVSYDLGTHRGEHRIVPDHYADRLQCSYTTTLTDGDGATTRIAEGTMTVRALIGSRAVENAIIGGLREYADAETGLLAGWPPDDGD